MKFSSFFFENTVFDKKLETLHSSCFKRHCTGPQSDKVHNSFSPNNFVKLLGIMISEALSKHIQIRKGPSSKQLFNTQAVPSHIAHT